MRGAGGVTIMAMSAPVAMLRPGPYAEPGPSRERVRFSGVPLVTDLGVTWETTVRAVVNRTSEGHIRSVELESVVLVGGPDVLGDLTDTIRAHVTADVWGLVIDRDCARSGVMA